MYNYTVKYVLFFVCLFLTLFTDLDGKRLLYVFFKSILKTTGYFIS